MEYVNRKDYIKEGCLCKMLFYSKKVYFSDIKCSVFTNKKVTVLESINKD